MTAVAKLIRAAGLFVAMLAMSAADAAQLTGLFPQALSPFAQMLWGQEAVSVKGNIKGPFPLCRWRRGEDATGQATFWIGCGLFSYDCRNEGRDGVLTCRRAARLSVQRMSMPRDRAGSPIAALIAGERTVVFKRRTFLLRWGGRSVCQTGPYPLPEPPIVWPADLTISCGVFSYGCNFERVGWGARVRPTVCRRQPRLSVERLTARDRARAPGDPFIGDVFMRAHLQWQKQRCKALLTPKPGQIWVQPPPQGCSPWMAED